MKILVIDTKLMFYKRFHQNKELLGFTQDIANVCMTVGVKNFDVIVFATDKGKSRRVDIFPEYKAQRDILREKQNKAYKARHASFTKDYNNLEEYLKSFGEVVALEGVEADDIASVIASCVVDDDELYLLSSDSDWIKFLHSDNIKIINPQKNKIIDLHNVKTEYEVTPKEKVLMDCIVGVSKENVKGIHRFGKVAFRKFYNEAKGDEGKLLELLEAKYGGTDKLPDGFTTVRDMVKFNLDLFRPWTIEDLTEYEADVVTKAMYTKKLPTESSTIMMDSVRLFNRIYAVTMQEKNIFKIN